MISMLRELWLFFRRDLSIARTYRTGFLFEAIEALFELARAPFLLDPLVGKRFGGKHHVRVSLFGR